jgi:hypothetical protein
MACGKAALHRTVDIAAAARARSQREMPGGKEFRVPACSTFYRERRARSQFVVIGSKKQCIAQLVAPLTTVSRSANAGGYTYCWSLVWITSEF